jgi:hypothetical protein
MDPLVRAIKRKLEGLVDACISGEAPFASLTRTPPFDWFIKRVANAGGPEKEKLWEAYRVATKWKFLDIDEPGAKPPSELQYLDAYYKKWAQAHWVPKEAPRADVPKRTAAKAIREAMASRLLGWKPFKSQQIRDIFGADYICAATEIAQGKLFLVIFDLRGYGFDVSFGLLEPFFKLPLGCFWGHGQTLWFYDEAGGLNSAINQALNATLALSPVIIRNIEACLESNTDKAHLAG